MILYNVTVNVAPDIHDEWLVWMKNEHIPEVLDTGLFVAHKMLKLLTETENDGTTYAIQYFLNDISDFETYRNQYGPGLQAKSFQKFGDKMLAFRTLLEVME
jgi:hypothetical protein